MQNNATGFFDLSDVVVTFLSAFSGGGTSVLTGFAEDFGGIGAAAQASVDYGMVAFAGGIAEAATYDYVREEAAAGYAVDVENVAARATEIEVEAVAAASAATDAANEATDAANAAANAATDAALAAAEAADAATAAAQDASDAVAALSAQVGQLIAGIKAQITSLTNLVIKIQKKVRASYDDIHLRPAPLVASSDNKYVAASANSKNLKTQLSATRESLLKISKDLKKMETNFNNAIKKINETQLKLEKKAAGMNLAQGSEGASEGEESLEISYEQSVGD